MYFIPPTVSGPAVRIDNSTFICAGGRYGRGTSNTSATASGRIR